MQLEVKLDTRQLEEWASVLSARGLKNAIRRAVDKSATAARKVALKIIAQDAGVPAARIKPGVSKVKRTTQGSLSASFTASKLRIGIMNTKGAKVSRGAGLRASTFRVTGGRSASLNVKNAFLVHANGGTFVAVRKPGVSRLPIKGLYAEMPNTAMGQDDGAARIAWQKEAEKQLAERLPVEIAKQLVAEGLPYSAPADSDD
ncbi:hypothetical protein OZ411_28735 [Bradyrhizobium sp. Arg237L]|uniref:hypothetical protein n=1 Tax=Bradyrhizobium sp. Arg237L TaxID=3003352 RepID=UPI00249EE98F|nr:hypothetical protein [Bradyrhizobium sp. Arg237L]MDI4236804.1 hypothetical protein [Bradyrhizobium sp. Arg237L]